MWRRGLALFPDHPELIARLQRVGAELTPDTTWLRDVRARGSVANPAGATTEAPAVIAFAPLRAEVVNHQFQEARAGTTLRRLDVYTMPGGTGEMLQALQAMPGATRAGDGAELYIRGGDPAETPVFFDGGRLAFPGRWETLQGSAMGVVDASVLRRAYFSSGGFSARYGNALSGVVDVETEGRPARASHRFGANMVQAGTTVRAQAGERTGVWGTLSGTDTRLITQMTGETDEYSRAPQSVQGVGGVSFEPLPGIELRTTALAMSDRFGRIIERNGYTGSFDSWSNMQHVAVGGRALRPDGQRGASASLTASRRAGGMTFGVLNRDRRWACTARVCRRCAASGHITGLSTPAPAWTGARRQHRGILGIQPHPRWRGSMASQQLLSPTQLYEHFFGPAIFRPLSAHVIAHAAPRRGERVLDLACGTGIVARQVAELVGREGAVIGADINPAMIAAAREFSRATAVGWIEMDATKLQLKPGTFNLVICQQGLQFFSDRLEALRRVRHGVADDGRLVVAVWQGIDQQTLMAEFARIEARHLQPLGVSHDELIAPFSLGDEAELHRVLTEGGFSRVSITDLRFEARFPGPDTFTRNMETAYAAVIPAFAQNPAAFARFLDAVESDTREIVARYTRNGMVCVPMPVWIAEARP
jgi:SAM-dependent methyltransferase